MVAVSGSFAPINDEGVAEAKRLAIGKLDGELQAAKADVVRIVRAIELAAKTGPSEAHRPKKRVVRKLEKELGVVRMKVQEITKNKEEAAAIGVEVEAKNIFYIGTGKIAPQSVCESEAKFEENSNLTDIFNWIGPAGLLAQAVFVRGNLTEVQIREYWDKTRANFE